MPPIDVGAAVVDRDAHARRGDRRRTGGCAAWISRWWRRRQPPSVSALAAGRKLLAFGNGGSAGDAQHLVTELVGRFQRERAGLAAIALTADTSLLTSVANDYGFERVFARQIEALGRGRGRRVCDLDERRVART